MAGVDSISSTAHPAADAGQEPDKGAFTSGGFIAAGGQKRLESGFFGEVNGDVAAVGVGEYRSVMDEPSRFSNGKQVGSYAGLTPKQYQSGQMDRQGHISGQGNRLLRSLLVEVSWCGLRYNPWVRQTYERIRRGSENRKKIAIRAVARKLLVRCWAMLCEEQEWRENNRSPADKVTEVA